MGTATVTTVRGFARLGRRTKELVHRLEPGEIAVIDHECLDRTAARELVARRPLAVVNVAPSTTNRPAEGSLELVRAGIRLVDADPELWDLLNDGDELELEGGRVLLGGEVVAEGRPREESELAAELEEARERVGETLREFAENTLLRLQDESGLLTGPLDITETRTRFEGRPALVVARGESSREDLRALRRYIARERPVLVAVDGGADLLLGEGLMPQLIVGDMDSATRDALHCGAELLVHAYRNGDAPGARRLEELGLTYAALTLPGTSQDAALLLAHQGGAEAIVSVGAPLSAAEFLDRGRDGMSSSFLTRLRVGDRLIDAAGANRLLTADGS